MGSKPLLEAGYNFHFRDDPDIDTWADIAIGWPAYQYQDRDVEDSVPDIYIYGSPSDICRYENGKPVTEKAIMITNDIPCGLGFIIRDTYRSSSKLHINALLDDLLTHQPCTQKSIADRHELSRDYVQRSLSKLTRELHKHGYTIRCDYVLSIRNTEPLFSVEKLNG